jgi:ATP-dependent Lhr-like helicase
MRAVLVESARARLLNEACSVICTECWSYVDMVRVKDLPETPKCPKCGSKALGLLKVEEERIMPLVEKKGEKLTKGEEKIKRQALQTARLVEQYGKVAAVALSARKVQASDAKEVLERESKLNDRFYELVLEAERKAISKRFW